MNNNPFDNYRGTSDSAVRNNLRELPMRWYKFLIYVALWFSAAVNILGALPYFTGTSQTEEMLAQFPILSTIDLFYGVLTLGMGALALYTRFALAGYKKTAPRLVVGVYAYCLVISRGYSAAVIAITSSVYEPVELIITGMSVCTSVIINAALVICNHIYFKKRKRLFNK
jgi:hypothetical protein